MPLSIPLLVALMIALFMHLSMAFAVHQKSAMAKRSLLALRSSRLWASSSSLSSTRAPHRQSAAATTLPPVPSDAHRVVFMRHGESEFNNANIFTGWCDIALTRRGICEAIEAGQVFYSHRMTFRKCYTSLLTRSIVTAQRALETAGISYTPIQMDWRINERHYGALQGLSKERTADRLGRNIVMEWRRSFDARPPDMTESHPHYDIIHNDARYSRLLDQIPLAESLQDCQERVVEAWNDIRADIRESANDESSTSLVVAHANSLRALIMSLDDIAADDIENLNIPTAIPFFYDICRRTGRVLSDGLAGKFRGVFIADERKKRSFLERRRAANDPWLWALHDEQVEKSMLVNSQNDVDEAETLVLEGLDGVDEEAKHNTEVFSSTLTGERLLKNEI